MYALLCLNQTGERKAMRAFGLLAGLFRELAGWVQGLAEMEADRADSESPSALNSSSSFAGGVGGGGGGGGGYSAGLREARANSANCERGEGPRSSFLAGRQASDEGMRSGMGMGIRGVRSRGLAELVGRPDFFIELHVRFVAILARLRILMEG